VAPALQFLCPRCRAGLCNGCRLEGLLTCAFAACCAKLPENPAETVPIGDPSTQRAPDQPLSPRRPGRKTRYAGTSVPALKRRQSLAAVTPQPSVHAEAMPRLGAGPRCRAGLCNHRHRRHQSGPVPHGTRFYALIVGRGFSTVKQLSATWQQRFLFLCPRHRAEICDRCTITTCG
jgi:hypothetical protein